MLRRPVSLNVAAYMLGAGAPEIPENKSAGTAVKFQFHENVSANIEAAGAPEIPANRFPGISPDRLVAFLNRF